MDILNCTADDAGDIKRIEDASFSDAWSKAAIGEEIANRSVCLSAFDHKLSGYVFLRVIAPEAEILRIAVEKRARHGGYINERNFVRSGKKEHRDRVFRGSRGQRAGAEAL